LSRAWVMAAVIAISGCASGGARVDEEAVTAVKALPPDTMPSTDIAGMPRGFGAEFAMADARARRVLYHQQCAAAVPTLRARGKFGTAASAPRAVYCARTADGIPLGGVYDIDSGYTKARRLTVIRLDGAQPRWTQPIDTARVAKTALLSRDAARAVTTERRGKNRPFTVLPLYADSGAIEAWVMPRAAKGVVIGGDIGVAESGRVADRTSTWRAMTIPTAGVVTIRSAESGVAAVSDLVVARMLAERGRDVVVVTSVATSALVPGQDASGSRFTWQHAPTRP
jgi:hypothetical protein